MTSFIELQVSVPITASIRCLESKAVVTIGPRNEQPILAIASASPSMLRDLGSALIDAAAGLRVTSGQWRS